jgi:hypothetical protein
VSRVLTAGQSGEIGTYIIFPSGLYGLPAGPAKSLGTIQSLMISTSKKLGFVPYVGEGTAIFNTVSSQSTGASLHSNTPKVHVLDVIPFILQVLDLSMKEDTPQGCVYERCYIIGANENRWKDVSAIFAQNLHSRGIISSPEAKSVTLEGSGGGEISDLMASDMFLKYDRAKKLGYKPTQQSLVEHLKTVFDGHAF